MDRRIGASLQGSINWSWVLRRHMVGAIGVFFLLVAGIVPADVWAATATDVDLTGADLSAACRSDSIPQLLLCRFKPQAVISLSMAESGEWGSNSFMRSLSVTP